MANSHGLTSRIVKKQAAARKLAKNKKNLPFGGFPGAALY